MATERVIRIDTTQAQKNVEGLDKNVQQLGKDINKVNDAKVSGNFSGIDNNLKKTSEGFKGLTNEVNKTAITIDQIAPNIAKIGAGIAGGFSIVSGAITLFGNDSEEAQKAVTQLQFYLQQLPLSFFAIAESITAASSTLDTFKPTLKKFGSEVVENIQQRALDIVTSFDIMNTKVSKKFKELTKDLSSQAKLIGFDLFEQYLSIPKSDYKLVDEWLKGVKLTKDQLLSLSSESQKFIIGFGKNSKDVQKAFLASAQSFDLVRQSANKLSIAFGVLGGALGAGLVVAIAAGISALSKYIDKIKDLDKASQDLYNHTKDLFDVNTKGLNDAQKQITIVETLIRNAKDETNTLKDRQSAIRQLNKLVPEYNATLTKEGVLYEKNSKAISDYIAELKRQAVAQAAIQSITEKYQTIIEKSAELQLAKQVAKDVQAAEDLRAESYNKQLERAGKFNDQMITVEKGVWEETSKVLTASNRKIVESIPELEKSISQAYKDIEYIYTTFDTNIELVTEKAGNGSAKVGQSIEKLILPPLKQLLGISDEIKNVFSGRDPWIKYFVQTIIEARKQIMILNDVMSRFGESSLGLGAQYANVVSDFSNMFDQMTRIILEKGEVGWGAYTKMASSGIQAVGTLLNALGDEQDTTNKEGFETQKKYQISASVMNMLAGILSAWTSAMTIPPPAGPILCAANSAMIGALGAVQIAKIKSQKFGDSASASSSAINSTIIPPVDYSRLVQGSQTVGAIRDTRQYVSVVEIDKVQKRVNVSENEARY